jgi:hypothetical protein
LNEDRYKNTRRLIWLYFILLIFEGVLRKWVFPSLSNPLLVLRDPVVLLIYLSALADGSLMKRSGWLMAVFILGAATFVAGFLAKTVSLPVMAFGYRTNFLHLPLIFVMATALTREDVLKIGKWILLGSVPMALLMLAQFRVGPDHWLNAGAGEDSRQIVSAMGKVRASGTFSFITGPVAFFAMVTAFLLYGQVERRVFPLWLVALSTIMLMLAAASAGSRSLLGEVVVVGLFFFAGLVLHPPSFGKAFRVVIIGGIAYLSVSLLDIFHEASEVMKARIDQAASGSNSGMEGYIRRITDMFYMPIFSVPIFGSGLGVGTNAGAAMLGAKGQFLLAENEWNRVVGESGPVLGLLFVLLRVSLAGTILSAATRHARVGNLLPILLFGSCAVNLVNGQFGPPTVLGFAVFGAGCAMACMNFQDEPEMEGAPSTGPGRRKTNLETPGLVPVAPAPPRSGRPAPQPGRWTVRPSASHTGNSNV